MPAHIQIIRCTEIHIDIIADLIIALLKDFNERSKASFLIDKEGITATITTLINRDTFGCYIALDNKKPVGLITIAHSFAIYNGGDFGVITELYVDHNQRSNGIGKLLLEKAYEFARQHGWQKIEVGAPNKSEWPRTLEFYKQNGFSEKGPKLRITL